MWQGLLTFEDLPRRRQHGRLFDGPPDGHSADQILMLLGRSWAGAAGVFTVNAFSWTAVFVRVCLTQIFSHGILRLFRRRGMRYEQ